MPSYQGEEHHGNQFSALEDIQKTFSSPRHFLRRQAVVESQMQDAVNSSSYIKNKATVSKPMYMDHFTVNLNCGKLFHEVIGNEFLHEEVIDNEEISIFPWNRGVHCTL